MRKLLIVFISLISFSTFAEGRHGWHHGGGHYVYQPNIGWVVPAIVGGLIVYEATRPSVVVTQPAPVVTPPAAPVGFHWEAILDAKCNCYRTVLVNN